MVKSNQKNSERAHRPRQRPTRQLLCWPHRREGLVPLAGDHHGPGGLSLLRRCVLPQHPLPDRLPVQAGQAQLHDVINTAIFQKNLGHIPFH